MSNGKTIAVAKRPMLPSLNDSAVDVYIGTEKIFRIWEDFFDGPMFVYPFADGKRFLCDYNDDTAILVFIVDFNHSNADELNLYQWPSDDQLRAGLARMATNVVFATKGRVRLPSHEELQEVSSYLASATYGQIKQNSFPYCDFGVLWNYAEKDALLLDLATNRNSYWPLRQ